MTNQSLSAVIESAKRVVPPQPIDHPDHHRLHMQREMLLSGIALDMAQPRPSLSEVADALGVSKSSVHKWERLWRDLPWRERYSWLLLVSGAVL